METNRCAVLSVRGFLLAAQGRAPTACRCARPASCSPSIYRPPICQIRAAALKIVAPWFTFSNFYFPWRVTHLFADTQANLSSLSDGL